MKNRRTTHPTFPAAFLVALLAGGAVLAQGSGSLVITVVDDDGLPLPGATVTIEHETGQVKPYSELADGKGRVVFPVLRPGLGYAVSVAMPGFGTRREKSIRVPIGDTVAVTILLAAEVVERVRVTASANVVDLADASSTSKFSDEFMSDLPVPGRSYQHLLTLAPGVNDANGDGNPTVHGSRSRDFQTSVSGVSNVNPLTGQFMSLVHADSIEEMEIISSGAGVEFGRAQGGYARIIQKQGTNRFQGAFSLLYRSSLLDGTGAHDNDTRPDPEFDEVFPSLQLSGPVIKDKLWYRLSHAVLKQEDPINTVGEIVIQNRTQGIHSDQLTWQVSPRNRLAFQLQSDPLTLSGFGVSSALPADSSQTLHNESMSYQVTWTSPVSPKLLVETTAAWQDLEQGLVPTQTGIANSCVEGMPAFENTLCENSLTGKTSGSHNVTQHTNTQRFTLDSRATLHAGRIWGATHQLKFGFAVQNERFYRELELRPRIGFALVDGIGGSHNGPPILGEDPVITADIAVPGRQTVRSTGTNWAVYLEDQIKPVSNFVITAGLRLDRAELNAHGMRPFDPAAEQQSFFARLGPDPDGATLAAAFRESFTKFDLRSFLTEAARATNLQASRLIGSLSNVTRQSEFWSRVRAEEDFNLTNTNISPALSISWDPWKNGKNKFAASARRQYQSIMLAVPLVENNPVTTTLSFDVATDPVTGKSRPVGLRGSIHPTFNIEAVDRNMRTPYQDEWRLVYERELFTETLLRVEYIHRKYRDQLQNVDLNHRPGDFGRCRLTDNANPLGLMTSPGSGFELVDPYSHETYIDTDPGPGDGVLDDCMGSNAPLAPGVQRPDGHADLYTQNPAYGSFQVVGNYNRADYDGFVIQLKRRQYRSWEMDASYTWSMATGNGEDFRQFVGLDPSLLDDEYGYQSNDQRHVVKLAATTITPWGFRLGMRATWASGLPYSVLRRSFAADPVPPYYSSMGSFSPARERLQYPTGARNSERNDSQWLFDVMLTKELNLGLGVNVQLSAEIFNLLNDGTYKIYNPNFETGAQINGVNGARQEFGRRWQLGMRLTF